MPEKKHIRTFRSKKLHPEHVKLLNEAIRRNAKGGDHNVHLTYVKGDGTRSERKVKPLSVKGKSLFVAHCHERDAIRSFRVERIEMIKKAFNSLAMSSQTNKVMEEALKQDPAENMRNFQDMMYYFGEKGRQLRSKKMIKKAFWEGFEKRAANKYVEALSAGVRNIGGKAQETAKGLGEKAQEAAGNIGGKVQDVGNRLFNKAKYKIDDYMKTRSLDNAIKAEKKLAK
jgi:hypothetical protein